MQLRLLIVAGVLIVLAAALGVAGLTRDLGRLEHLPTGTLVAALLIGAFAVARRAFRPA